MKRIGKFQLSKFFLSLLDRGTYFLLKEKIWDNVDILVVDIGENGIYHFIGESELFVPIEIGTTKIPEYEIIISTDSKGYFIDFKFNLLK